MCKMQWQVVKLFLFHKSNIHITKRIYILKSKSNWNISPTFALIFEKYVATLLLTFAIIFYFEKNMLLHICSYMK